MHAVAYNRVSPSALPIALLVCSAIWFVGACAWYAASASKDAWSATPLFWMLMLTITPISCVIGGVTLIIVRRHSRLTWIDWCALGAASVAVVLGGFLALMVLGSMRGMGIL